jgi:Rieske Fe-S protein
MASTPRGQHPDEPAGLSRRTVLRGAVVLGGTGMTGGLAACGGGAGRPAAPAGSAAAPAPVASGSAMATTVPPEPAAASSAAAAEQPALIAASRVPQGGGVVLADQKVVVTQPTAGQFKAFSAVCTHQGCLVAEVSEAAIVCYCHGSRFSIDDGSVTNPPAQKALPPVTVTVRDGDVVRG